MPGSDHVVTLTFDEGEGVTTFAQHFLHLSKGNRDGHLESGMDTGLTETFNRLEGLLASMVRPHGPHPQVEVGHEP
jgi:hypothetical protein